MQKHVVAILAVAISTLTFRSSVMGQGPTISAARSAVSRCAYDVCALRIEPAFFGSRKLVVGLDGVRTDFGMLGGGLIGAVDPVPAALAEARQGRRKNIVAAVAGIVAAAGIIVSLNSATSTGFDGTNDGQLFGALAVGAVGTVVAVVQQVGAERHYSRAVWLYNRELPR